MNRYFVVGGAGFIGSHIVDRLMEFWQTETVTAFDRFSHGRQWSQHLQDSRLQIICDDVMNAEGLLKAMAGHDVVIHLASNPDIAKAATKPYIDFCQGTMLTQNVLEAMRLSGVSTILYASGSGVYGDYGETEVHEDSPKCPISTYGASKLAGEALISAYCHMFGFTGRVFRFSNVVGARQTHGVGRDFLLQLLEHPERLRILGDGAQSKPYIHVDDVVSAVMMGFLNTTERFAVYNVATQDHVTVDEIVQLAIECVGLDGVEVEYTGGNRGWKGDVPVVRMNSDRIRALGWKPRLDSREAVRQSLAEMLPLLREKVTA